MRIAYLRRTDGRTDRQTDREKSALVELRFAAKNIFSLLAWQIDVKNPFFLFYFDCRAILLFWNNKYVVVAIKARWDDERGRKWGAWLRYYLSSPQVWASIHIMHSVLLCAPIKHSYHKTIIKANLTQEKLLLRSGEKKAWGDGILKLLKT